MMLRKEAFMEKPLQIITEPLSDDEKSKIVASIFGEMIVYFAEEEVAIKRCQEVLNLAKDVIERVGEVLSQAKDDESGLEELGLESNCLPLGIIYIEGSERIREIVPFIYCDQAQQFMGVQVREADLGSQEITSSFRLFWDDGRYEWLQTDDGEFVQVKKDSGLSLYEGLEISLFGDLIDLESHVVLESSEEVVGRFEEREKVAL